MRVLLDENLPHRLRSILQVHEVATVAHMRWSGVKNGELLRLAETNGFEVFITADQNLRYQQNLDGRQLALVVLTAQKWEFISLRVGEIVEAIAAADKGSIQVIEYEGGEG